MDLQFIQEVVSSASALRFLQRLQPAGGMGDKIFPATYEKGQYAEEKRFVDGQEVACIHLDSVQSQANRMEQALLRAVNERKISLPIIQVDFLAKNPDLMNISMITTLDAPHRMADAILRDSEKDGIGFRKMPEGKALDSASIKNATELFGMCPTALLFGIWDSTGPRGGMGAKFQRSIVSEIVAFNTVKGVKSASRIDPLGIVLNAGVAYKDVSAPGGWTLEAKNPQGKALQKVGKEGKPSEINHGNVTPSFSDVNGGVTFSHALQTTVISLPSLRRLNFPIGGTISPKVDLMGRTVLALIGLCATLLTIEGGYDLRSRCLLVPENPAEWEVVGSDGSIKTMKLDCVTACQLLEQAIEQAVSMGLPWSKEPLTLVPSDGLVKLVARSQELAMNS